MYVCVYFYYDFPCWNVRVETFAMEVCKFLFIGLHSPSIGVGGDEVGGCHVKKHYRRHQRDNSDFSTDIKSFGLADFCPRPLRFTHALALPPFFFFLFHFFPSFASSLLSTPSLTITLTLSLSVPPISLFSLYLFSFLCLFGVVVELIPPFSFSYVPSEILKSVFALTRLY